MNGAFFPSFGKSDLIEELNSSMAAYKCDLGYHENPTEYEKNAADKVADLAVK